jgi:hypothetical protein
LIYDNKSIDEVTPQSLRKTIIYGPLAGSAKTNSKVAEMHGKQEKKIKLLKFLVLDWGHSYRTQTKHLLIHSGEVLFEQEI